MSKRRQIRDGNTVFLAFIFISPATAWFQSVDRSQKKGGGPGVRRCVQLTIYGTSSYQKCPHGSYIGLYSSSWVSSSDSCRTCRDISRKGHSVRLAELPAATMSNWIREEKWVSWDGKPARIRHSNSNSRPVVAQVQAVLFEYSPCHIASSRDNYSRLTQGNL